MSTKQSDAKQAAASSNAGATTKAEAPSESTNLLFHEAMVAYEKALESGIQLQEESVKLWRDLLARIGSPEALQSKLDSLSANLFPNARKGLNEFVETASVGAMFANRASRQAMELFGKSLGIYQSASIAEAQLRTQNLIEQAMNVGRENFRTILNTNLKIMTCFKDLAELHPLKSFCAGA